MKPYTVDFDASASTHTAALRHYQWDFDGNGTFDRHHGGPDDQLHLHERRHLQREDRHTDVDSDTAEATRTITVVEPPDLKIDSNHTDPFRVGTQGRYELDVTQPQPRADQRHHDGHRHPARRADVRRRHRHRLDLQRVGQVVTCTRSGQIAGNAIAPRINLDVNVTAAAIPGGNNSVSVRPPATRTRRTTPTPTRRT